MPTSNQKEKYGCVRMPASLIAELDEIASGLEETVANATTLKQQQLVRIKGGLHERFGCAKWKVVERLLHDYRLKIARQERYQQRKRKR